MALANKECLVCAGELLTTATLKTGARILPVDSEHNGIFQIFDFDNPEFIDQVFLTASGGPFLRFDRARLRNVTPEEAIQHPNWEMGPKISVDSATMMNKALEVVEAFYLFPIEIKQISVLIHPDSIVHSLVSFCDGSYFAQLAKPDMRIPIAYALSWPRRIQMDFPKLNMAEVGKLSFETPCQEQFPALGLAYDVLKQGGSAATVMNAANEIAVYAFLRKRIEFLTIVEIVETTLERINYNTAKTIEEIISIDEEARRFARSLIEDQ